MKEREVFLREIEYFTIGETVTQFFGLRPLDCSKITFMKGEQYKPDPIWKRYRYLDTHQKRSITVKTDEIFRRTTGVNYPLNQKQSKDRLLIWQKERIRECVMKNFFLHYFLPSTYKLSGDENKKIQECARRRTERFQFLSTVSNDAFEIFERYMKLEKLKAEGSTWLTIAKYLLIGIAFFMINAVPLLMPGVAALSSVTSAVSTGLGVARESARTLVRDSLLDFGKKLAEDQLDKMTVPEQKPDFKNRRMSFSEFLLKTRFKNNLESLNNLSMLYQATVSELTIEYNLNWSNEAKKNVIISQFEEEESSHYNAIMEKGKLAKFYIGEVAKFLANYINEFTPSSGSVNFRGQFHDLASKTPEGYFDLDLKDDVQRKTGFINILFEVNQQKEDLMNKDLKISFGRVDVNVYCPPSDNVKSGLQSIMREVDLKHHFGNPFDMPMHKILTLKFKDGGLIHIFLNYFIGNSPVVGVAKYGIHYYYCEPHSIARKNKTYNIITGRYAPFPSKFQIYYPYFRDMVPLFGKPSCDNLLLSFYNDDFKGKFGKVNGKRLFPTTNTMNVTQESLETVKQATREAFLR